MGGTTGQGLRALTFALDGARSPLGPPEGWTPTLRAIVDMLLDAPAQIVLFWGPDQIAFYNDAYAPTIGDKHPRALGRPARENWAELWDDLRPLLEGVRQTGEPVVAKDRRFYIERHGGAGEQVYFDIAYSAVREPDGGIAGVLCIVSETTERVGAETALRASEARHRALANAAGVGGPAQIVFRAAPDGRLIDAPGWERLTGQPPDRYAGRGWLDALHPDDRADATSGWVDSLKTGEPYRFAARAATRDGNWRRIEGLAVPVRDEAGQVTEWVGTVADVEDARRAEERRRSADQRFRELADTIDQVFYIIDTDAGRLLYLSPAYQRIYGRDPAEIMADLSRFPETIHPEDRENFHAANRGFHAGQSFEVEYRIVRPDGEVRWILDRIFLVKDAAGRRSVGIASDITERRRMEAALAASEAKFEAIVASVDQMIWSTRPDGFHDFYNQRWYDFTGVPEGSTNGEAWNGLFHPDDQPRAWTIWRHSLETGAPYHIEYRLRHHSGRYRWVLGRAQCVRDAAGAITRWFGTCTDIQEIVEAREVLARSRAELERAVVERTAERNLLATMMETADAPIQAFDRDGNWLAINRAAAAAFERQFGIRPQAGQNPLALLADRPAERAHVEALLVRAMAGEFSLSSTLADGRHYETRFSPLHDAAGERIGAYSISTDVTERMDEQARLREAEERLRQAQKIEALGQLTGGVAHDFNNLLMVVSGGLEMLARGPDEARRERIMGGMRQAVNRGAGLSRQLLAFSRRQPLSAEPVDLAARVEGMRELLDRSLRGDVDVETRFAADLWPVEVDPGELELVLLNLAVNARDAMAEGGTIVIAGENAPALDEAGLVGDFVRLSVADSGSGMSQEVLARAIEPFFTTKDVGRGSGLGLAQCHGFARASGGEIRIASAEGRGTTVTLLLPRTEKAPVPAERVFIGPPQAAPTSHRGEVLLVEDDDEVAALTGDMLQELGYSVTRVSGPAAALGALANGRPIDLVFSDIMMPGPMNGVELACELKARRPELPVLLTSGYADAARRAAAQAGLSVLAKPFRLEALERALAELRAVAR